MTTSHPTHSKILPTGKPSVLKSSQQTLRSSGSAASNRVPATDLPLEDSTIEAPFQEVTASDELVARFQLPWAANEMA